MEYISKTYDPYTYMVIDADGIVHYVSKKMFEHVDERLGFSKRKVSNNGTSIMGFIKQNYLESDYEQ